MTFRCPLCGRVSQHPTDLAEGYCGACHDWTGVPVATLHQPPQLGLLRPPARRQLLLDALGDIAYGRHDAFILDWLASTHDTSTVATLASLILRARTASIHVDVSP